MSQYSAKLNPCAEIGMNDTTTTFVGSTVTNHIPTSSISGMYDTNWQTIDTTQYPNEQNYWTPASPTLTVGGKQLTAEELSSLIDKMSAKDKVKQSKTIGAGLAELLNGL